MVSRLRETQHWEYEWVSESCICAVISHMSRMALGDTDLHISISMAVRSFLGCLG